MKTAEKYRIFAKFHKNRLYNDEKSSRIIRSRRRVD